MDEPFEVRYLPLFESDLASVCDHIALALQNPQAALRLIEDTERAILKRSYNPLAFKPFYSNKNRKHPYYRINIRNYVVFYVVIGNIMEVRRFVYSRRNLTDML